MKKLLYVSAATVMTLIVIMIMTAALGLSEAHALTPFYGLAENPVLNFNTSSNYEYEEIDFDVSNDNVDMVSSNESVCLVYNGKDFAEMGVYEKPTTYWYVIPVGSGTATITATNREDGSTWTGTVNVTKDYFQHMLDSGIGLGPVMAYRGSDVDAPEYFYTSTIAYGSSCLTVRAPFGAWVSYYIDDDLVFEAPASWSERVDLKKSFLISMKTPVKVKIEWKDAVEGVTAVKEYKVKIVSKSSVAAYRIKKNTRKGKADVKKVHKGDYLKIKVGKKVVKTVKFKSAASKKTVKWTNKKKMKKGTKVKYTLYNKYKEKLATKTRKVG